MRPEAILFDLFETLVTELDPEWAPGPALPGRLGVDEEAFWQAYRLVSPQRNAGKIPDYGTALLEIGALLRETFDAKTVRQLVEERRTDKARPFARVSDDIVQMLISLGEQQIRLGVISNASVEEVASWGMCPLASLVHDVVFSYEVGLFKPDARIYHLACERLGLAPESVLFIGDGGSDELLGAEAAGLRAHWATWFLDRWPPWKCRGHESVARFPRLRSPEDVLAIATNVSSAARAV